jgi:hypothetical protein
MGRKSLSLADYRHLADEFNLDFIGPVPGQTRQSTTWRCRRCLRLLCKSYNNLKYGPLPCTCYSHRQLHEQDYRNLADRLGLIWQGDNLPQNTKQSTQWFSNAHNVGFEASYHVLAYGNASKLTMGLVSTERPLKS